MELMKLCLISLKLVEPYSRDAAGTRKDHNFTMLKDLWDQGPKGVYHRPCYQSYTNKTNLDRLVRKWQAQQVQPQSSNEPDVASEPLPKYKTR